jgi:hypothetical protein
LYFDQGHDPLLIGILDRRFGKFRSFTPWVGGKFAMLDTTTTPVLATPPKIDGNSLARHLPLATRVQVALQLLHGEVKGAAIAQALRQASAEELTAFAREFSPEALWDVLITAL